MGKELTTAQVAERFSVTPANVRLWCKRGLLPNAREVVESRGSVWKIPEGDLKDFEPPKRTGRPKSPTPKKRAAGNGTPAKKRGRKVA